LATETAVTELAPHQIKEAGEVLARAFYDDPAFAWILPDDANRARALSWLMGTGVRYGHMFGRVHTSSGNVASGAVWLPPGDTIMSPLRMIRAGMMLAPFKFGVGSFRRFLSATNHLEHLHKRDVSPQHWYLMILGVDPPRQGQGLGGAVIQPILARADRENLPCYLETAKERNLPFYRKYGFEVAVEADFPHGGPHFWTMLRQPAR
jgi:GNAT superfamily N-acetyltransferase